MRKEVFVRIVVLSIFLLIACCAGSVKAADSINSNAQIDKAYSCLRGELNNQSTLTLEQAIFAALAIGSNTKISDTFNNYKDAAGCWPKQRCTIKETAQVLLALKRSGGSMEITKDWLETRNITPTELTWYLEIDVQDKSSSQCEIRYGSRRGTVKINDDMTLSSNTLTDCLSIGYNGYWLKISQNCLDKEYTISCNKDFVTALAYQKRTGETVYVASESNTASANSTTTEKINAKCFSTGRVCDYEGTLWAAFVLNKLGEDVSAYLPYLSALAEDNLRFFPTTFLYAITTSKDSSEYYTDILQKQNRLDIWEVAGSIYNKYYDTSLALIALNSGNSGTINEVENAKKSLLTMQRPDGCWSSRDSIIDTGFILYSGWQRTTSSGIGGNSSTGGICEPAHSCEILADCSSNGGQVLTGYDCSGGNICCSVASTEPTCAAQQGIECPAQQECTGDVIHSSDVSQCCLTTCQPVSAAVNNCQDVNGTCKTNCGESEEDSTSKSCGSSGMLCCIASTVPVTTGTNWWLIILLIILIILVILAIIYRDKLQIYWYKFRGRAKTTPVVKPGVPPMGSERPLGGFRPSPKFAPSNTQRPVIRPQYTNAGSYSKPSSSEKDKELEETLKKLKDMSK